MGEAEEVEAHSSQTSQKSLALELYLAIWLPSPPPPRSSEFLLQLPYQHFPLFFFSQLVICFLTPPCSKSGKHASTSLLLSHPLCLLSQEKKEKKRKKPCNQCKQAGQTCGRTCVRVYVRNMFLDNMLMCCESACSSENNLLIRRVLFVGAYMLTSAKCMVSWFKTTVFKSAQNVKEEMNLLELDFLIENKINH